MATRGERRRRTENVIKQRAKEHGEKASNRLAKKHPLDCGKSRCQLCHSDKVINRKERRITEKKKMRNLDDI